MSPMQESTCFGRLFVQIISLVISCFPSMDSEQLLEDMTRLQMYCKSSAGRLPEVREPNPVNSISSPEYRIVNIDEKIKGSRVF